MTTRSLRSLTAGAIAVLLAATAGCSAVSGGAYEMPLPGGPELGANPMTITAHFKDALDLVPQSSVKVGHVDVGQVTEIRLAEDGHSAIVEMQVNESTDLPAATTARIQQTSLLGEKFIGLLPVSPDPGGPRLDDGASIGLSTTTAAAGIEEVLGALSLLLNGGGLGQAERISRELQQLNGGRTQEIKAFMRTVEQFVGGFDARRDDLVEAIDGIDVLTSTLAARTDTIDKALVELTPAISQLAEQRADLVKMLDALKKLSDVSVTTIDRSADAMVQDLESLEPILDQLARSGRNLPRSLEILLTFPFPDSVLSAIEGDYFNTFLTLSLRTPGTITPQPVPDTSAPPLLLPPVETPSESPSPEPAATQEPSAETEPTAEPSTTSPTPSDETSAPTDAEQDDEQEVTGR